MTQRERRAEVCVCGGGGGAGPSWPTFNVTQTGVRQTTNYKTTNYKVHVLAAPVPKSQIGSEGLRSPENVALRTKPERKLSNCNLDNITTDASPQ